MRRLCLGLLLGAPPASAEAAVTAPAETTPAATTAPAAMPLPRGTRLLRTGDGHLFFEGTTRHDRPSLVIAGLVIFGATYSASTSLGKVMVVLNYPAWLTIPIAGPAAYAIATRTQPLETALLVTDTALQAAGFTLLLVGAFVGPAWKKRVPVLIEPTPAAGGAGLVVSGAL